MTKLLPKESQMRLLRGSCRRTSIIASNARQCIPYCTTVHCTCTNETIQFEHRRLLDNASVAPQRSTACATLPDASYMHADTT